MKTLPDELILRPRFQLEFSETKDNLLKSFENSQTDPFLVKRVDEHVFIKFNKKHNHFWSPQLHLKIIRIDAKNSKIYGVFGPNPTLWTFFMFLHFGIATLFVILSIWAYSSASLNKPYALQVTIMACLIIVWFVLYFFGRAGKQKGKPQMELLYKFVMELLMQRTT